MPQIDRQQVSRDFRSVINMTPAQLTKWLGSEESRAVGYADGRNKTAAEGTESVGHASGRRIIAIKRKKKADLTEDDFAHMRKVVGYVHRHLAQRPDGDIRESRWRYSLMNWGHDPAKDH